MSTIFYRQAAAASEKDAVKEAEKEFEKAAAVRRAAFYADPSSPSREVCGKHTLYAIHIRTDHQAPRRSIAYIQSRHVASGRFTISPPYPALIPRRRSVVRRALTRR